jgi:hypothetical protein
MVSAGKCDECQLDGFAARRKAKVKRGPLRGIYGMVCTTCIAARDAATHIPAAHIGWRVAARGAVDNFELQQAAELAMQMLFEEGEKATLFHVTKILGQERLDRLDFQPSRTAQRVAPNHQPERA